MSDQVEIYKLGNTLVAHGATWAFVPGLTKDDFAEKFVKSPITAERDYAANPPQLVEQAMRAPELAEQLANRDRESPVNEEGGFHEWFVGEPANEYYLHIDMSKARDATGVGLCHYEYATDKYVLDLIHNQDPSDDWELSFERVFQLIMELDGLGFNLVKITFDTWQSYHMIEKLRNAGFNAEHYSVDRGTEAYDTLFELLLAKRLDYYYQARFVEEIKFLKLYDGKKYDHDPQHSKDTSDACAGAVTNCVKARVGLSLREKDVKGAIQAEVTLPIISEMDEASEVTWFNWPDLHSLNLQDAERTRRRVFRFHAAENMLISVLGWHDKAHDVLMVDHYLVWHGFAVDTTMEAMHHYVIEACRWLNIDAISLNELVPLELVTFLQRTGRKLSSPLQARSGTTQRQKVAKTPMSTKVGFRVTVAQIRQGNLKLPNNELLIRDLYYATEDNLNERKYVAALAGWVEFMSKYAGFGPTAKVMPKSQGTTGVRPMGAQAAAIGKGIRQRGRMPTRSGDRNVDLIRARYAQSLKRFNPSSKTEGSEEEQMRSLPRIKVGPGRYRR